MKKYQLHKANTIRFRRWSRKAYAVFASLGKSVTIGSLSVQMAGDTLFRKVQLIKCVVTGEREMEHSPMEESALLLTESALIVNFVNKTTGEYPAVNNQYLYHLS